ncbi:unnamed protein product [Aphanomyces euteiches]
MTQLYYWLALLLVSKVVRAIVWCHATLLQQSLGFRFASGLKGVLFQKVLSKASYTQANVPDLANVYTADMDALIWASSALHNLWILPTQVVLISYMLYNEIGVAAFAGMGVIVLSLLVGAYISKIQSTAYAKFSQARDVRMKAVKETFGSILYIKLHALEAKYHEKIQSLRDTVHGL